MNIILSLFFIVVIIIAQINHNHKLNVFFAILSIVCDTLYMNIFGLNFLLIYFIGYLNIPFILKNGIISNHIFNKYIKAFRIEFLFLVVLGVIFGFLFPWEDLTGKRLWNQTAQGRTIVQLFRLASEFILIYYFASLIILKKITLRHIIYSFAIASTISFWVGFFDFFMGYPIKTALFDLIYFESGRFLGLNGEPKALGRIGAFSFSLILLYLIYTKDRSKFLKFSLITNLLAVGFSSSASSIVLFALMIISIFFSFDFKKMIFALFLLLSIVLSFNILEKNKFLEESTSLKINNALFGNDTQWVKNEPKLFTRFDIWDRLALIYLWQNPIYMITGVGPNLISIPMSKNIPDSSVFYELGRVDSVPNVMFNNILSRSGLIGIILFAFGIFSIYSRLSKKMPIIYKKIFFISFIFNMVYFNVIFFTFIGIILGFYHLSITTTIKEKRNTQKKILKNV